MNTKDKKGENLNMLRTLLSIDARIGMREKSMHKTLFSIKRRRNKNLLRRLEGVSIKPVEEFKLPDAPKHKDVHFIKIEDDQQNPSPMSIGNLFKIQISYSLSKQLLLTF